MSVRGICNAAIIAALYVALSYASFAFGLSSGAFQIRLSEALCVLPYFTPYAVPGLFIGCILSNMISGSIMADVIFGSLATLLGALVSLRIKKRFLVPLPNVLANTLILPWILSYAYHVKQGIGLLFLSIGFGEIIASWILGVFILSLLEKLNKRYHIFKK